MCVLDLSVLQSVVLGDKQYTLGAIVARRLHNNSLNGDLFGGIYATRVANFLEIPMHENDKELLLAYLDYSALISHQFLERNEQFLQYRLIFDRRRTVHVILPAPALFDYQAKIRYVVTREEATEHERRAEAARLHAAAQQAITVAQQYDPNYSSSSQYDPNNYYYGYPPGQSWP